MSFTTDKQTLDDLSIFGKAGADGVFSIYNRTYTRGGAELLEKMFLYPLSSQDEINDRSQTIQQFCDLKVTFPFRTDQLDSAEIYMAMTDRRTKLAHRDNGLSRKFDDFLSTDGDYKLIRNGIAAVIGILNALKSFLDTTRSSFDQTAFGAELKELLTILEDGELRSLLKLGIQNKLTHEEAVDCDDLIRFRSLYKIKRLLSFIYNIDVYLSVAEVALSRTYVFPKALNADEHTVQIAGLYHPLVKNAVANNISITPNSNIVFLTGANMAGKSTFMKSLGIALYLAHMGFPVAASHMEFSVRDGLYTTINLPDDLGSGNSHFYAEVLRVKKIAKELGVAKNLFIIFDELFRGTNVKDAYEGTIALTEAFAHKQNCMFIVSTHIIEAGDVLRDRCNNINFLYLPTKMEHNVPVYTYKLEQGITADRHGMIIINNEGILDILRSRKGKNLTS